MVVPESNRLTWKVMSDKNGVSIPFQCLVSTPVTIALSVSVACSDRLAGVLPAFALVFLCVGNSHLKNSRLREVLLLLWKSPEIRDWGRVLGKESLLILRWDRTSSKSTSMGHPTRYRKVMIHSPSRIFPPVVILSFFA